MFAIIRTSQSWSYILVNDSCHTWGCRYLLVVLFDCFGFQKIDYLAMGFTTIDRLGIAGIHFGGDF